MSLRGLWKSENKPLVSFVGEQFLVIVAILAQ